MSDKLLHVLTPDTLGRHRQLRRVPYTAILIIASLMSAGCAASASTGAAGKVPLVTSDVFQSSSSATSTATTGNRQVEFDGASVEVIDLSGASTVKVLDGAVLVAVDDSVTSAIQPLQMLQQMADKDGMLTSWISRAGQRQLYYGALVGSLGRWKQGQVLAYLRLADGPTCVASQPYTGPDQSVNSDGTPCNIGILAPSLGDGENATIEGVY